MRSVGNDHSRSPNRYCQLPVTTGKEERSAETVNQYETSEARILSALSLMRVEPEFNQEKLKEIKARVSAGLPHYANEVEGEEDIVYG